MGLLDTYAKSATFESIGKKVGGRVVRDAVEVQQRDFDTNDLLFWDDGNPRMQLVVTVDTGNIDPTVEDDDGERAIYIKGQMLSAVKTALKKTRSRAILEGAYFAVTLVNEEETKTPSGKKGFPKKIYEAEYEPPADRPEGDEKPQESRSTSHQGSLRDAQSRAAERTTARRDDDEPPF